VKPLLIQRAARQDLEDATAWYRERNPTIAERFVGELRRTLVLVEKFPSTGARVPSANADARRLPIDGFPYHLVFQEFADRVEVLAVAHDRRRPGYWRR
jgi:plasmid stabilization system protein ParE